MIELPWVWIGGGLLAGGVVFAISLRLDTDVPPHRRRRTENGGIEIAHHDRDDERGGRDA